MPLSERNKTCLPEENRIHPTEENEMCLPEENRTYLTEENEMYLSEENRIYQPEELRRLEETLPPEEKWKNLGISNDFIFARVMEDPELCREFLERLLEIKIAHIEYPETQKTIHISKDQKSIRLDVYVEDGKHTVYNLEMQAARKTNLPKRSRYYQGMIDMNLISKGADYNDLNKSMVIFICTFDLFGKGRHRYTFKNLCVDDTNLPLGDETTKIFFNTKGTMHDISRETKKVLNFIDGKEPEDEYTENLAEKVKKIKENKEWEVAYMTMLMREREKFNEGIRIGEVRGAKATIDILMDFGYSSEKIAETIQNKMGLTKEQAEEYVKKYQEGTL
jgi:predicted transposase/invertase (TIGR01784 family)